ncbi:MAG: hypothetical protein AAF725_12985 [Acidobacteriota bacterium]
MLATLLRSIRPSLPMAVLAAAALVQPLAAQTGEPALEAETAIERPSRAVLAPLIPAAQRGDEPGGSQTCDEDGVVLDDGTAERGFGWVPSAIEGIYVQEYSGSLVPIRGIDSVCVCFQRSQNDDDINFDVVFYGDAGGVPEEMPFAAIPGFLDNVDMNSRENFVRVSTEGVEIPAGTFYVGVRWNPSVDQSFFVCDDQSEETAPVNIFFRDDRARGWDNAFDTIDPIFLGHRALLFRPVGTDRIDVEIPTASEGALALLAGLIALAGLVTLRR